MTRRAAAIRGRLLASVVVAVLALLATSAASGTDAPERKGPPPPAGATPGAAAPGAAVQGYTIASASSSVAPHQQASAYAVCPSGTRVIGGSGALAGGTDAPPRGQWLNSSRPLVSRSSSGWQVFGNNSTTVTETLYARAICATGIGRYQIVVGTAVTNASHTQSQATVTCPTGTVPLGGGGYASSSALLVNLNSTFPLATGWRVDVNNNSTGPDTVTPSVVCGARPTGYQQLSDQAGYVVDPGENGVSFVDCPTGTKPVGGGAYSDSSAGSVNLKSSFQTGNRWVAIIDNGSTTSSSLYAYVVCAQATGAS